MAKSSPAETRTLLASGASVIPLILRPQDWINRRVETLSFEGETQVRRRVSLDADLSFVREAAGTDHQSPVLVPLTLLAKRPLTFLDVRDDGGRALPVLGREENGTIAYASLLVHALLILSPQRDLSDIPESIPPLLESIARAPVTDAEAALAALQGLTDARAIFLCADIAFIKHASDLARNFLLVTEVPNTEVRRQVIKFSYAYSPRRAPNANFRSGVVDSVRPGEARYRFESPAVADAASYHFQLMPPPGLEISEVRLHLRRPFGGDAVVAGSHLGAQGHVQTGRALAGTVGNVDVHLQAVARGQLTLLVSAALFALAITGLSAFFSDTVATLSANSDAAAALLLAVPGLVAVYLAVPGEASIVARTLVGARRLVLAAAFSLYVLAAGIAIGLSPDQLRWTSIGGAIICALSAIPLATVWIRAASSGRSRGS